MTVLTEFNVTEAVLEASEFQWDRATWVLCVCGLVITIVGVMCNYLCYRTAAYLPESTSAGLVRYLAIWDSLSAIQDGILHLGFRVFDVNLASVNVRHTFLHSLSAFDYTLNI